MILCSRCRLEKSPKEFYRNKKFKRGFNYWCVLCFKEYRAKNSDRYNENAKRIRQTPEGKLKHKASHLKSRYGINLEDIPDRCQVCKSNKNICVDHCHETNRVRGFLCVTCNLMLGYAKDKPQILENLTKYIKLRRLI